MQQTTTRTRWISAQARLFQKSRRKLLTALFNNIAIEFPFRSLCHPQDSSADTPWRRLLELTIARFALLKKYHVGVVV